MRERVLMLGDGEKQDSPAQRWQVTSSAGFPFARSASSLSRVSSSVVFGALAMRMERISFVVSDGPR